MSIVVERSRLCVDYGITLGILHALMIWISSSDSLCLLRFGNLFLILSTSICTITVGRTYCIRRELLPIPLGSSSAASRPTTFPFNLDVNSDPKRPLLNYYMKKLYSLIAGNQKTASETSKKNNLSNLSHILDSSKTINLI